MEEELIIQHLEAALDQLIDRDRSLLEQDLSEQSISHRLAIYLEPYFAQYNVDCEYNGNVDRQNGRKKINLVKHHLIEKGLLTEKELNNTENEIIERSVFPDIIIHRRGRNDANLCIIEVKKSTSNIPFDYDGFKLEAYTTNIIGNDLNYQLGIFLIFRISRENPGYEPFVFYKNGERQI